MLERKSEHFACLPFGVSRKPLVTQTVAVLSAKISILKPSRSLGLIVPCDSLVDSEGAQRCQGRLWPPQRFNRLYSFVSTDMGEGYPD